MTVSLTLLVALAAGLVLAYRGRGYWAWFTAALIILIVWAVAGATGFLWWTVAVITAVAAGLFGFPGLRRLVARHGLMPLMRSALPRLGKTEKTALEAGTVWWDGDLFSGDPDWNKLLAYKEPQLTDEEQAFIDGPVTELCRMIDDWQIAQDHDLPEEVWQFLGDNGFFAMIIPKAYGGKEFSPLCNSRVVTMLASRSVPVAVTVMVPNSLGPAELLLHYGTQNQKDHYLPRLASGDDIPCFALTGPEAGSDAGSIESKGVVCERDIDGEKVLGIRLTFRKRYITLAPVATLIGLAFKLEDPDGLLGSRKDLGITCALVPSDTPGVKQGNRHDCLGVHFHNGTLEGEDVFVPMDAVIGGREGAGEGWTMLMDCLAAGRAISLPALAVGCAQLAARVTGAYATVREQFNTPIGRFEGIEEPLGRIGGHAYFMGAVRSLTCGALNSGEQPAVISAIAKAYMTESMRRVVMDAMDIRAGSAIVRGRRNILARAFQAVPIGITVEGANILTRTMIVYGQGAIRCHPFVQAEIESVADDDVARFDKAIFGHINHATKNFLRSIALGLTGGRLAGGQVDRHVERYFQQLTRFSAAFASASEIAMLTLGGKLKRREKIAGRLADALAWMYIASATLKRYSDSDTRREDLPFVQWSCETALYEIQTALDGVCSNLDNAVAGRLLRFLIFPWGRTLRPPSDRHGSRIARALLEDRAERERLTSDIFVPDADEPGLGGLEAALDQAVESIQVETKLRDAVREGRLERAPGPVLAKAGLEAGVITEAEYQQIEDADEIRAIAITVDEYTPEEFAQLRG
jgi:acyl-CoA dehydrogenase